MNGRFLEVQCPSTSASNNPIDNANTKMHMSVQAGVEAVSEGHGTDVQGGLVHIRRFRAVRR